MQTNHFDSSFQVSEVIHSAAVGGSRSLQFLCIVVTWYEAAVDSLPDLGGAFGTMPANPSVTVTFATSRELQRRSMWRRYPHLSPKRSSRPPCISFGRYILCRTVRIHCSRQHLARTGHPQQKLRSQFCVTKSPCLRS